MATLTWDALGGDPAPGDPTAFDRLSDKFNEIAADAAEARSKLARFKEGVGDSIWRGESAHAFRDKIGKLPPRLAKLHDSYSTAADGMAGYARALRSLQDEARTALVQAQSASADVSAQKRSLELAQAADPSAPTVAHAQAIASARRRLEGAEDRIGDLRQRRRAAENVAIAKLDRAHDQGIPNDPWWKRAWDAVDRWVDEHADILQKVSQALSFVAGVLSVIPGLQAVALVVGGLAVLTNVLLAATGNGSWKTLMIDAALAVVGAGAGRVLVAGVKAYKGAKAARAVARPSVLKPCLNDPIDIATGEMVIVQTDVELPASLPLVLGRAHVSSFRAGRWFGAAWASTLDQRIEVEGGRVLFSAADGMLLAYPIPDVGAPVLPDEGPRWPLARQDENSYTITDPATGEALHFAGAGSLPLAAITDRNGHRIDVVYGGDGRVVEIRHSGGYRISVETAEGRIRAYRLLQPGRPDVTLVRFAYDGGGRLSEVLNSSGLALRFEYDGAGRIVSWQDRNGCWYRYTYDGEGRCVRTDGAGGCLSGAFDYDRTDSVTRFTNSLGHAMTFHLNERFQVVREEDPLGGAVLSEWDPYDRLLARTDELGRTTRYDYDAGGNLVRLSRPDGSEARAEYNELGLPTRVVDPDGAVWRHEYDGRGNETETVDPVGARTRCSYDDRCHLTTVTDALGHVLRVDADAAGLVVAVTDALGATTRYRRDAFGRVVAITDALGGVTRVTWTVEGKLATWTDPGGATERWTYDGEGNEVEYVDAAGHVARTEIAHFDLPAAEIGPDGTRLQFSYDTELRLVAVTNPQGLEWRYEYDAAGNLVREVDFDGRPLAYRYDPAGQLVERVNGAGQSVHFGYDLLGNVVEERAGETVTRFSYDGAGRVVRATNADADVILQRDQLGQIVAETCNGRTVTSTYDRLGRRSYRRTATGSESVWEYDPNDEAVALRVGGRQLQFTRDAAGREVERRFGAATVAQSWDAGHRLVAQARGGSRRSYTYRADGYITAVDEPGVGSRRFDLDPVGQVTAVRGQGWDERYAYDAAGNITSAQWRVPWRDRPAAGDGQGEREYAGTRLRRAGAVTYEHDAQGRAVARRLGDDTWSYAWDENDRLVGVTTPDGAVWRYTYDALGRRISKRRMGDDGSGHERVDFVWDGTTLAEEIDTGSGRARAWEWEPGTLRPVVQAERGSQADGSREWVDERVSAVVTDVLGTATELLDPSGAVTWRLQTTLWGGQPAEGTGARCPFRFPGQYSDDETGLHHNYFRYYDPLGRYLSNDPLGLEGSLNPSWYVPNPTVWADPFGLALCRSAPRLLTGNAKEGWVHIEGRHITGTLPGPPGQATHLFPRTTTRAQVLKGATKVVKKGQRVSDPARRLQTFERRMSVNGMSARYRAIVDSHDANRLITFFPVGRSA